MEPYIKKNTELRKESKNALEKCFFKLMNNNFFGKTIENIRKRVNVKLVNDKEEVFKLAAKPNFDSVKIFSQKLVAFHMKKTLFYFNKILYVALSILDLLTITCLRLITIII